jgi:hypothetical protein
MDIKEHESGHYLATSLEEFVPKDNFYRCIEERLDLSFVRELVADRYIVIERTSNRSGSFLSPAVGDVLRTSALSDGL